MAESHLAQGVADLLNGARASEPRSLNQLVMLATRQVRGCSGATAGLWRGTRTVPGAVPGAGPGAGPGPGPGAGPGAGEAADAEPVMDAEPVILAASHPDLPELIEVQLASGRGPVLDALAHGGPVSCPDTLVEARWPEYARAALRRGVRCSVTIASRRGQEAVTLSLFGARPRLLLSNQGELAELLLTLGDAAVGNAAGHGEAQRTAAQLRGAAESRAVVDQAKEMLMQELGCSAEDALAWMRRNSQERNLKMADIARMVISDRSGL